MEMKSLSIFATAFGAVVAVTVIASDAHSNARICRHLEQEARETRPANSGASRASLKRELDQVERQMRRSGCSGLRLIFNGNAKQCGALRSNMNRLRPRLRSAQARPSRDTRLRKIEAEIRRNGCRDQRATAPRQAKAGGDFRTLCVRKCDGYYFPISFATAKSDLQRDDAACKAFYPACKAFYPDGAAELYIDPSRSNAEAVSMVSLASEAYSEQSFALNYRSAYEPACAALLRPNVRAAGEGTRKTVAVDPDAIVPVPVARPRMEAETVAVVYAAGSRGRTNVDDGSRTSEIRVVGPANPYIVSAAAGSAAPLAANSRPRRLNEATSAVSSLLEQLTNFLTPAAQAEVSQVGSELTQPRAR